MNPTTATTRPATLSPRRPRKSQRKLGIACQLDMLEPRCLLSGLTPGLAGTALTSITPGANWGAAVLMQSDGKTVVAGTVAADFMNQDIALARYNADGSLDDSFGTGGMVVTDLGSSGDAASAIAIDAQGGILVAGQVITYSGRYSRHLDFALARYNSDGTLDANFGQGGFTRLDMGSKGADQASAIAVQSDGNIVVAGTGTVGGRQCFAIARYTPDGWLDYSFAGTGYTTTNFPAGASGAYGIALQSDGRIVLAGKVENWSLPPDAQGNSPTDLALARYNADGTLDSTFGNQGLVSTDLGFTDDAANAVALAGNDIVIAGRAGGDFLVARYLSDGTLDGSFGNGGVRRVDFARGADSASAIAVRPDGKILLAGEATKGAATEFALAQFDAGGTLDPSFETGGRLTVDFGRPDQAAAGMALDASGMLAVAGYAGTPGGNYDFATLWYRTAQPNLPPVANAGGSYAVDEGGSVALSAAQSTDPDGAIVSYEWDLNYDGVNFDVDATGASPTFSAANIDGPATRTIALRVTDNAGAQSIVQTTVTVANVAPTVDAGPDQTVNEGAQVVVSGTFTDPGVGETYAMSWLVVDGKGNTVATGQDQSIAFAANTVGVYTVTYSVSDGQATGSDTMLVTVRNVAPTVNAGPDQTVNEGTQVVVSGTYADPGVGETYTMSWLVVDGKGNTVATGQDPSIAFAANTVGVYTVTYSVSDGQDTGSDTMLVNVRNVAPTPRLIGPATGVRGQTLAFAGSFTDPGASESYQILWNFGDGRQPLLDANVVGALSPTHVFAASGQYTVHLTISDSNGGIGTASIAVNILDVQMQSDPANPGQTALVIGGTSGNDTITVRNQGCQRGVDVTVNSRSYGTFNPTSRIVIYTQQGADTVRATGLSTPVVVYSDGDGDDTIQTGPQNNPGPNPKAAQFLFAITRLIRDWLARL